MERMMWANGLWNTLRTHNYIKQEEDNRLAILFLFYQLFCYEFIDKRNSSLSCVFCIRS